MCTQLKMHLGIHKIVILDEADSLTEGAQQALRMIISDYADTTRYITLHARKPQTI